MAYISRHLPAIINLVCVTKREETHMKQHAPNDIESSASNNKLTQLCSNKSTYTGWHSTVCISPYLDAALARVGQVGHLLTCAGVLFYQHCPGPGKPASQTFYTDLKEIFHKWFRNK